MIFYSGKLQRGGGIIWSINRIVPNPYYRCAQLKEITADEVSGTLRIGAEINEEESIEIIYEGMYYSQLDERSIGLVINIATEITPTQLIEIQYQQVAAQMYEDCGADEHFLRDMFLRGNRLFIHFTDKGAYLVLAKRLIINK